MTDEEKINRDLDVIEQVLGNDLTDMLSDNLGDVPDFDYDAAFVRDLASACRKLLDRRGEEEETADYEEEDEDEEDEDEDDEDNDED
jgi:hypothetical protein